jgi:hypothetical protein
MLELIHEAGFVIWFALAAFAIGLVRVVMLRRAGRSASAAAFWAGLTMAVGMLNTGGGQHKVDAAVQRRTDPTERFDILTMGTREASSNLFLAGACAILLLGAGGAASLGRGKPQG